MTIEAVKQTGRYRIRVIIPPAHAGLDKRLAWAVHRYEIALAQRDYTMIPDTMTVHFDKNRRPGTRNLVAEVEARVEFHEIRSTGEPQPARVSSGHGIPRIGKQNPK